MTEEQSTNLNNGISHDSETHDNWEVIAFESNTMSHYIEAKNDPEQVQKDINYSVKSFIQDHLFFQIIHLFKHI